MKQFKFPHIGMRTTKTAVAVMLSYLIFVPFGLLYNESYPGVLAYVGPTYSCIACIVCMQSSLEQTLRLGSPALWGCSSVPSWGWLCYSWSPAVPLGGHRPDAGSRLCVRDLALHALQPARGLRHGLHPPLRHAHFR